MRSAEPYPKQRFGKEDTAKELQDHAAKTQDTLVDAVENAEVAEIKRPPCLLRTPVVDVSTSCCDARTLIGFAETGR